MDVYEGVKLEMLYTVTFGENSNLSTTYSSEGYTTGNLLASIEC